MTAVEWQRALQDSVPKRLVAAMAHYPTPDVTLEAPPDVVQLVGLLQNAVAHNLANSSPVFVTYLKYLFELMSLQGPGPKFRLVQEFIDTTEKGIKKIASEGGHVTDLWLAQADYHARTSNRDRRRCEAIRRAVDASMSDAERLRAMLIFTTYHIDGSGYRKARELLEECAKLATRIPDGELHMPDILVTRGISYVYSNPSRADALFQQGISLGEQYSSDPEVRNAIRAAYNYRGRLKAAQGDYVDALRYLVKAREYALGRLADSAFFHLRLAEILMDHGPIYEARYHLDQSAKTFDQARDLSLGAAQLSSAWARYFLRMGDKPKAERLLKESARSIRQGPTPRVELKCLVELAQVQLSRFKLVSASLTLARLMFVLCARELPSGRMFSLSEFRALASFAPRILRFPPFGSRGAQETYPVTCPCGAAHNVESGP